MPWSFNRGFTLLQAVFLWWYPSQGLQYSNLRFPLRHGSGSEVVLSNAEGGGGSYLQDKILKGSWQKGELVP